MEILGGPLFSVAGAGESHGPALSTIIFGCPPGVRLSRESIQEYLDRRRPGSTKHGTARRESDRVVLLSGLYQEDESALLAGPLVRLDEGNSGNWEVRSYEVGLSTGEPIAALVLSTSGRSKDYEQFVGSKGAVRPGHADLVRHHKARGYEDPRGGGRSSYRATVSDVIGGAVARIVLDQFFGTMILSSICQVGPLRSERSLSDWALQLALDPSTRRQQAEAAVEELSAAEVPSIDSVFAARAAELIRSTRIQRDSLGAAVEVVAINVPPLLGEPLYQSLKLRIAGSLGGLHAVQSVEIGDGIRVVERRGSENNDPIRRTGYAANSHGGLLGGITTGSPLVCRVGFKPTSSIPRRQLSVRKDFEEIDFELAGGRHDPCVGVRAGVTLESRVAIELLNGVLLHQSRHIDPESFRLFPPGK